MDSSEITLEAVASVSQIAAEDWDACANPAPDSSSLENLDTLAADSCAKSTPAYNPFVSHAFFLLPIVLFRYKNPSVRFNAFSRFNNSRNGTMSVKYTTNMMPTASGKSLGIKFN